MGLTYCCRNSRGDFRFSLDRGSDDFESRSSVRKDALLLPSDK